MKLEGTATTPNTNTLLSTHNAIFTCYIYQELMYKLKQDVKQVSFSTLLNAPFPFSYLDIFIGNTETGKELEPYAKEYVSKVARNVFDYLVLACWGEMRHGSSDGISRKAAYAGGIKFNPQTALTILEEAFNYFHWGSGYGGKVWGKIAKAASLYFTFNPILFLDHVVDISHHGGLAFNKGIVLQNPEKFPYLGMLNEKHAGSLFKVPLQGKFIDTALPKELFQECCKDIGIGLSLIQGIRVVPDKHDAISEVPFIAWGDEELTSEFLQESFLKGDKIEPQEEEEPKKRERNISIRELPKSEGRF